MNASSSPLEYEPIRCFITTTNAPNGEATAFIANYERLGVHDSRLSAIGAGLKAWGHDDFNIAVWKNERLVSWDWMEEAIDEPDLATFAEGLRRGEKQIWP